MAAATSGLILAGVMLPAAALAGPGSPPTAVPDTITTTEGAVATGNVLTNDSNPGEGTLSVTGQGALSASVGTLVIDPDGAYTFTPADDWFGTETTSYDVTNDKHTRTAVITIEVANVNDAPTADDDSISVDEDVATDVTAAILSNDTDPDSDTLAVESVSNVTGGTADVASGGVTFTGDADACDPDNGSFDYVVSDGNGETSSAHVTVTIDCVNDDPSAGDDSASGTEDTDVQVTVAELLADDTDTEGDTLSVTSVSNPTNGSVSLNAGVATFIPDADVCGPASAGFDYAVEDGNGGSDIGHVDVDLTCVNETPVAGDDTISGDEDTDITVTSDELVADDTDGDPADVLTVTAVANATGGSVALDSGTITFTPDANLCGSGAGSFDYTVEDGNGGSDTGSVTVDVNCVNDNPATTDDTASGIEDTDLILDPADLASDDSDVESPSVSVTGVSNAAGGTAVLGVSSITFTPDANLCGTDVAGFDYTVEDADGGTATGHVTISLDCVNDDPTAGDDLATVTEDTATDVTANLLDNDEDVDDGDTLAFISVSNAVNGSAVLDAGAITFTPDADVCGAEMASFDYTVADGNGGTDTAQVVVSITCVNDDPTAADDDASGTEDTDLVIPAGDLEANASDVETSPTLSGVSNATGGTVALDAGIVTFTPTGNLCGDDVAGFDYTVEDGDGGSDTGHITIDLTCVNDAPTAGDDTATVLGNSGPAAHAVLGNDSDVDGDTLNVTLASVDAAAGTVGTNGTTVTYTPAAGWTGEAVINYTISDGALTATATLTVTVGGDVTAPIVAKATVAFATGRVNETAPLRVSWSATDASSGVASYQVQVRIGTLAWKNVYTGAATSIVKFYPFTKYLTWRVRATDVDGNLSGWVNSSTRRIVAYQNKNTTNVYRGAWHNVTSEASSGHGYAVTTTKGDRVSLTFTGRAVLYVAPKNAKSGYVKVYVDGKLLGRYSEKRAAQLLGQIIARKTWTANSKHTIRVVNDQGGKQTNFDAFIVLK